MIAFALIALFLVAALVAVGTIGTAVSAALPRMQELKLALRDCPDTREMRFTIREIVVVPAHGKVVALPLRFKPVADRPLRAAA